MVIQLNKHGIIHPHILYLNENSDFKGILLFVVHLTLINIDPILGVIYVWSEQRNRFMFIMHFRSIDFGSRESSKYCFFPITRITADVHVSYFDYFNRKVGIQAGQLYPDRRVQYLVGFSPARLQHNILTGAPSTRFLA